MKKIAPPKFFALVMDRLYKQGLSELFLGIILQAVHKLFFKWAILI